MEIEKQTFASQMCHSRDWNLNRDPPLAIKCYKGAEAATESVLKKKLFLKI